MVAEGTHTFDHKSSIFSLAIFHVVGMPMYGEILISNVKVKSVVVNFRVSNPEGGRSPGLFFLALYPSEFRNGEGIFAV